MATDPARHYWQLPTFALGVAACAVALWQFPPTPSNPADRFARELSALKAAVEKKPVDTGELGPMASAVSAKAPEHPEHTVRARFLAGTAHVRLAESDPGDAAAWAKAAEQFAQVDPAGLPDGDRQAFTYRKALADAAGGAGDAAAQVQALALAPAGEDDPERRRLYADALTRVAVPDLVRARTELDAYLTGPTKLPESSLARLRLKLGEVCVVLGDAAGARTRLVDLGKDVPADVRALAEAKLGALDVGAGAWANAAKHLDAALADPALPAAARPVALYHAGVVAQRQNDAGRARGHFAAAAAGDGPAPQAARVRLADTAFSGTDGAEYRKAADQLIQVAAAVPAGGAFANPYCSADELRGVFEKAGPVLMAAGEHAAAVAIADASAVVSPRAAEAKADALAGWAALMHLDPAKAPDAAAKAKEAAGLYGDLAQATPVPAARADYLRRAAKQFRHAGDEAAASRAVETLLAVPGAPDEVVTAAWVERGEALLASNQFAEGAKALRQAVAKAAPDAAASARVKLAVAHIDQAKQTLKVAGATASDAVKTEAAGLTKLGADLLDEVGRLPADSPVAKDAQQVALFELGKLNLSQGNLPLAEERFRKLVQQYPAGSNADQGRLYLGCTLLQLGRGDHLNDRPPANANQLLAEAAKLFQQVGTCDSAFLRTQADIRLANTTFLLKKYDEMPALCDRLAKKYTGTVEELIVLSLLYSAQRVSDKPADAAATFARADEAYTKLPDGVFTEQAEEYSRAFWQRWLDQLKKQPTK